MSGGEKIFLEGLKRLGIGGNLLKAIMESHKECTAVMEGFIVNSPSGQYSRGNAITPEQVSEIVRNLDDYEKEIYNSMTVVEKRLFIADKINEANGFGASDMSTIGLDDKIVNAYKRKIERIHKHKELEEKNKKMEEKRADREARREVRLAKEEHKDLELTDPNFGGVPIQYRTYLYVEGKRDYTETYKKYHPNDKGEYTDLMLFVTNAVEDPERYSWWDKMDDEDKEKARKEASRKRVIFAMRTDIDIAENAESPNNKIIVSPDNIKTVFNELMSGKAPSKTTGFNEDSLFRGFGSVKQSGRKEANDIFFNKIGTLNLASLYDRNKYEPVRDTSELNGYLLASADRVRDEHHGTWEERVKFKGKQIVKEMKEKLSSNGGDINAAMKSVEPAISNQNPDSKTIKNVLVPLILYYELYDNKDKKEISELRDGNLAGREHIVVALKSNIRKDLELYVGANKQKTAEKIARDISKKYNANYDEVFEWVNGVANLKIDSNKYIENFSKLIADKHGIDFDKVVEWSKERFDGNYACNNHKVLKEIEYFGEKYLNLQSGFDS